MTTARILACAAVCGLFLVGCDAGSSAEGGDVAAGEGVAQMPEETGGGDDGATSAPVAGDDMTTPPSVDAEFAASYEGRNRLGEETSPYLLQHEHNPIHWYPWGDEAFDAARRLDRPIFLSVGYSTCYWCHVMERESFESEEIAAYLNEHFICIKLDREERPDVDDIYMQAVQILDNARGGWPMSVFIEPAGLKPFLAGTYFPPTDDPRLGRPGFPTVLEQVIGLWNDRRSDVMTQANTVADRIEQMVTMEVAPTPIKDEVIELAVRALLNRYDRVHAGYGSAPKFPMPSTLDFLVATSWDTRQIRESILHTLDRMAMGGMYDQVGGGFHRYSTDAKWLVPHFEKMLYDNGQLASTYAEAYARTEDPYYERVLRRTCDYVLREMTDGSGAFYSAQDAEVNAREGLNYLWLEDEVRTVLTDAGLEDDIEFALTVYGFDEGTNFLDPHHPEDGRKNVVFLFERPDKLAEQNEMDQAAFDERLDRVNAALMAVRDTREQPRLDDKVLVSWNGLMIAGMADAGRVLDDETYVDAARRAADWILDTMKRRDGGLQRTYRDGRAKIDGFLEDYAYFVRGLLALHRADPSPRWIREAEDLMAAARTRFHDPLLGGYFDTLDGQSDLFVRTRSIYDGAVPSANSIMLQNLVALYEQTANDAYVDDAVAALGALSATLVRAPNASVTALVAAARLNEIAPDRVAGAGGGGATVGSGPVTISADKAVVSVSDSSDAELTLTFNIAGKWHMNANEPGLEYLIPLKIEFLGVEGLVAHVDYPRGHEFTSAGDTIMVHDGTVTIPVRIEKTGRLSGRPVLSITYQVCDDTTCLQPQTVTAPVRIEVE